MDRTLFVIVGAGTSHDAAEAWPNPSTGVIQPPLVKDLFGREYAGILANYPMAQNAAPEIRDALRHGRAGEAISLETHLREMYRDSADPYDKRRFFSIALYLQDLLWRASNSDRVHFDNVDRLVTVLVRSFDHVCFITLNYDTILDQALSKLDPISSMKNYVGYGRWSLIKLHGSVDWGYAPLDDVSVDDPPADLDAHLDTTKIYLGQQGGFVVPPPNDPPRVIHPRGASETKLFPALTIPVGEDDEIVCPGSHQSFLDQRLSRQRELDVLVLGYSAYDRTVIERIKQSEKRIRTLTVVNKDRMAAKAVISRLFDLIPQHLQGADVAVADYPFGIWCREMLPTFAANHPILA
jgi:hypothetical protein